jgi:hypothetical protein
MSLALTTIEKLQQILTVVLVNIISIIKGVNNMKTSTIIAPFSGDEGNPNKNVYSHTLETGSIKIDIANNSHCDDNTDRTYTMIKTMYGDDIHVNQVDGWVSINGTRIQLKGHREGK